MNFALILLLLLAVTLAAWLAERFVFLPGRRREAESRASEFDRTQASLPAHQRASDPAAARHAVVESALRQPWWLEYTAGLFPVIAVVFVLRSFVVEPFKIPSGSMIPTLLVGDLILVNKYSYGVRLPVAHTKVFDVGSPQRGDVMVFRFPRDPSMDYIKRVVALPGDTVSYLDKRLRINDREVPLQPAGEYYDAERLSYSTQYSEKLGTLDHKILTELEKPSFISAVDAFPHRDRCEYLSNGVRCVVPPGHFFVMGDNRENSLDSRYWGFVPERNIVGKAFFIWMNFGDIKRIGRFH
ncbi:MAG: signal peptidase I [Burkholderiaceae bacterium]|nr:signal peptidase I [Burkholderiaceae bacterium]